MAENFEKAMRMFDHANDFSESADLLFETMNNEKDSTFDYTSPSVVYYAFSCEIYLKTLWVCYNIPIEKKHELDYLYNRLSKEIKEKIELNIYNCYDGLGRLIFDIETLKEISKSFEKWRYLFDCNGSIIFSNTAFLIAFRDALREECCQTIFGETWSVYKEKNYGEIR